MKQNLLPASPVFRRKMRKTVEYWEYFQVGGINRLSYLEKDGIEPKKVVLDGIPLYETIENWDEVKGPEKFMAIESGIVNMEEGD